jgi:hypothetical protein
VRLERGRLGGAHRRLALLKDWDEVVKVQNQATLDGSPVAQAVIKFMVDKEEYMRTSSELHKKIEGVAEARPLVVAPYQGGAPASRSCRHRGHPRAHRQGHRHGTSKSSQE